jgi:hypothetical protein
MVGSESLFLLVKSTAIILGIISPPFSTKQYRLRGYLTSLFDQHYAMKRLTTVPASCTASKLATGYRPVLPTW